MRKKDELEGEKCKGRCLFCSVYWNHASLVVGIQALSINITKQFFHFQAKINRERERESERDKQKWRKKEREKSVITPLSYELSGILVIKHEWRGIVTFKVRYLCLGWSVILPNLKGGECNYPKLKNLKV